MIFDKLSSFADGLTIPTTANKTTYSKVIDFRKCNLIDGFLKLYAQVVGTVNATGSVTTKLQVSDNGTTWTSIASFTQDGMILAAAFLPILGKKRFARLAFEVGGTALGSAVVVKAGLVDQFDVTDLPTMQTFPPLEDLAPLGDALAEGLVVSATAATINKGSSGTVTIAKGMVTTIVAPTKYTVTVSGATITIALAADASSGTVSLVDGLGKVTDITVTAAT